MRYEEEAVIGEPGGIHARIAAMIVRRAQELGKRYACRLSLRSAKSDPLEIQNVLRLVALKVACGDSVFVSAE